MRRIGAGEYGQVIEVGKSIRRPGARSQQAWFGTGLDRIEYRFDRYAAVVGGLAPVSIAGEVASIAAIHIRLTRGDDGWAAQPGSSWIEPLQSTRLTRRPLERIGWTHTGSDVTGDAQAWGGPDRREGDELLWGWRLTLSDAVIEPW